MANETQKFLSYEGLGTYDSKVKAYIVDKADAAKTSAIKADVVVNYYRCNNRRICKVLYLHSEWCNYCYG